MRIRFGDVFFKMVKKIKVLLNVFEFFCGQEIILIPWSLHINFYESPNRISWLRQETNASYSSFLWSFIKKKLWLIILCKAKVSLNKAVHNVNYRASFLTFQYIAEHLSDRLWSFYWNKINWLAMNTLPPGQNWIIKLGEFDEKYFAK